MKKRIRFLLAFLSFFCLSMSVYGQDKIWRKNGKIVGEDEKIKVIKETYKHVSYKYVSMPRGRISIGQKNVDKVVYGKTPRAYTNALTKKMEGKFLEAIKGFKKVQDKTDTYGDWILQYSLYHIASSYYYSSDFKNALKYYNKLVKKVPDSKFLPKSLKEIGDCYYSQGQFEEAMKAFKTLENEAVSKGFGSDWKLEGKFWQARISEARGDYYLNKRDKSKAKRYYRSAKIMYQGVVATAGSENPNFASYAKVRIGFCKLREGDVSSAKSHFENLLKNTKDIKTLSGAYNGIGYCIFVEAEKSNDKKKYKEAFLNFLHTVVLYYSAKENFQDALYGAGLCCSKLFKVTKKEIWRDKAFQCLQECAKYGGLIAGKANKKIKELKR